MQSRGTPGAGLWTTELLSDALFEVREVTVVTEQKKLDTILNFFLK